MNGRNNMLHTAKKVQDKKRQKWNTKKKIKFSIAF